MTRCYVTGKSRALCLICDVKTKKDGMFLDGMKSGIQSVKHALFTNMIESLNIFAHFARETGCIPFSCQF